MYNLRYNIRVLLVQVNLHQLNMCVNTYGMQWLFFGKYQKLYNFFAMYVLDSW